MPYAREENLATEVGEECISISQRTRFTAEELVEAARFSFGCGEDMKTFRKLVDFAAATNTSPIAVAVLINELAFEGGRAR